MKILVLDNYDSFTYNLVHYVQELIGHKVDVFRNDAISLDEVDAYDKIILSPGPGLPKDAGIMPELIKRYAPTKEILGVCLGHQAIGEAFGGTLHNIEKVYHGVATPIEVVDGNALLFRGLPNNIEVFRIKIKASEIGRFSSASIKTLLNSFCSFLFFFGFLAGSF